MLFGKKRREIKCDNCNSKLDAKFNFCPHCGQSTIDEQKERKEFGLLGRNDFTKPQRQNENPLANLGITDKLINSIMSNMMKSFDKQMKGAENQNTDFMNNADIEQIPNGIKIRIGIPQQSANSQPKPKTSVKKQITEAQLEKMSSLPRAQAKTHIRRLSDKIVYELAAPGIESTDDVFISKLETGYEIKAIGKKKVYVNSLPVSLPLRSFSIANNKLLVEFKIQK